MSPSADVSDSDFSHSGQSDASDWTKGRSRQRLRVPNSLRNNNFISESVIESKRVRLQE
jgi:hypothetical protein